MKVRKFFYLFMVAVLATGFVACGDDDDDVEGTKDDLKGTYRGTEKVFLIDKNRDPTYLENSSVSFLTSSKDGNKLIVMTDLAADIEASGFSWNENTYSYRLSPITTTGITNIPDYIADWLGKDYTYSSIQKMDYNLTNTGGTLDRKTNKLTFSYKGTVKLYFTLESDGSSKVETYDIQYDYPSFARQ